MFYYKTPREYIEGYNDPLILAMQDIPVYLGGDKTTPPFMSLIADPTSPANNSVSFFTGTDDPIFIRSYALW